MTRVAMIAFPRLTLLDLVGPHEIFSRARFDISIVAASLDAIESESRLPVLPTATFDSAPSCDVLFVPGGTGVNDAMLDERLLRHVRDAAASAQYVTSVCTGALILRAAGLLDGFEATTHWASLHFLEAFGATPVRARFHIDRNRITGGGVTAGIDFALFVVAQIAGADVAKKIQLAVEYAPSPPFDSGSPDTADAETVRAARESLQPMLETRAKSVAAAAALRKR